MEDPENTQFIDKVIKALRKSATEIEELQVQAALGKAEAEEKFEEAKKKFNLFLHESKSKIQKGKNKVDEIHTLFDELRVQLALGRAETKEAFMEQKKQLLLRLHEIEVKIKTNKTLKRAYTIALIEIQEFKLLLEVLEQRFEKGTSETKKTFEKEKKEFNEFVDQMRKKYKKKDETKWEHFQDEVSEAFGHLKKAFAKS